AVADAVAAAVEGQQRHEQNVGRDLGRLGLRLADAPDAGGERLAEFPGAHDQRLALAGDGRERELYANVGKLAHEWDRIDLTLHRREARDDRPRLDRYRKDARGDELRRPRALRWWQRVAPRQRFAAQDHLCALDRRRNLHP